MSSPGREGPVGMQAKKERVREFWDAAPCGTRDTEGLDELQQYLELESMRDAREPFIAAFAQFERARGKELLEVGVGAPPGATAHGASRLPLSSFAS